MKHLITLFFTLIAFTATAQDYYWVGGSGNWSDFANHWATTSGGTTFHTEAPTENNHVYFDANSFDAPDQELSIDGESYCNDMDWTGVTNSPLVKFSGSDNLNVHGSFTLSDDMTWDHRYIDFESDNPGNTISTGLISNFTSSAIFTFLGSGSWILQDSLNINEIRAYIGTLDLNGQYVDVLGFYLDISSIVDLSASEIHTVNFRNNTGTSAVVASTSTLHVSNSFYAGGSTYHEVVLTKPLSSTVFYEDDAVINTLTLSPGTNVRLESGSTITVTELVAVGTKTEGIELYVDAPGTPATLSQATGTVNGEYLTLQDITATGGATFNAANSIDNGNNTGWTITAPVPLDYYWVGDGGNWSDYESHWATSSGGTVMHTNVPGTTDNVYFDANSFTSIDQEVLIDVEAFCNNIDWTGVTSSPLVAFSSTIVLNVHGSFTLSDDMTWDHRNIDFESDNMGNTISTGLTTNFTDFATFNFFGAGSWAFQDSVDINQLNTYNGTLDLNGQYVDVYSFYLYSSSIVDLSTSEIRTVNFRNNTGTSAVVASTSTLHVSNSFYAGGSTYHEVVLTKPLSSTVFYEDDAVINTLTLSPGTNVRLESGSTITVTELVAVGTKTEGIELYVDAPGTPATLSQATGTVNGEYLTLQDITATGGATFNAANSIDNGNNTGWTITAPVPLDYYWVGDGGNWSDYESHWATSSGGTAMHTNVPGTTDNVYFDANSFTSIDQEVLIDIEAFCNNIDWTGVTSSPLVAISSTIVLNVHGSFTLSDNMTWNHRNIDFESDNMGNTISTGLTTNFIDIATFNFFGAGSWAFQDSVDINQLNTYNGTLDLNGQYADVFSFYLYSSSIVDLSTSDIHTVNFRNNTGTSAVVASTSTLHVSNSFYAGGSTYHEVVLTKPLSSTVFYEDDAVINTLTLSPGTNVRLESGSTITVTELVAMGTKSEGIELYVDAPGTPATLSQATGTVNGEYLTLQDITATGGATFNATNSIDNGNNTGWTITAPAPLSYYWVGDGGNWSDFDNHWATTSGGTVMHTDVPGAVDNVYFDANSFATQSTVTLDINANCADMDWTGLDNEVTLTKSSSESLSINGSLSLNALVSSSLNDIYFESNDAGQTVSTANNYLASKVWFAGGGNYMLLDSLKASNLYISAGSLDLNDQVVDLSFRFDISGSSAKSLDFGSSIIYTSDYYYTGSGLTLDAGTSTLVFQGTGSDMRGNGSGDIVYNKVVIEGSTTVDLYDHTFNSLELKPGATLEMGAGDILTVSSLAGIGTSLSPITIISDEVGTQAILNIASGTQEVSYVVLQDINATGGATFNAYSSTDNGNNTGWNFLADVTAPSFLPTFPSTGTIGGSQVSIDVQVDEPATIYSVTLEPSATAPTAAQIIAGTDASDAMVASESLFISEANVTTEFLVTNLTELESYDLYFALKDESDNIQSAVAMLDITTIDDSSPDFVDTYPKISVIGGTTLGFSISIQESGTVYYILVEDGSTIPSNAQVKAGNNASDLAAIASGSTAATSEEVYEIELTGLTETTAYDIYLVAEDANGNLSETPELLEATTTVTSQNYYWVGGSGDWSDVANHWATSSGGSTFYTVVPTEFDHVYFDANSFDAADQELSLDVESFCNDMNWTGVANFPKVNSSSSTLYVHGSFMLSDNMTWDHRNIDFESANANNTIATGLTSNFTSSASFTFRGAGSWVLQDSIDISQISAFDGTIDLNGQYIDVFSLYLYSSSTVDLSSSEIHAVNFRNYTSSSAVMASTSNLHVSNSFYAGGSDYNQVTFSKPLNTTVFYEDDATIGTLTFTPGTHVNLESGATIMVAELIVDGTKAEGIEIFAETSGTPAIISQASGTVNGQYLTLQDITATGGATFNATNSIDNGNNMGWTITAPAPLSYYWVGDGGNWSDFDNHWAITSGGTVMHTDVPGAVDNVYFDANSFATQSTVTLDINANCADMDWTGLDNEVTLTKSSSESLSINGSLSLNALVSSSLNDIYFESNDAGQTVSTANNYLANKVWFAGAGNYTLLDSLKASNLDISAGSLDLNDQVVDLSFRFDISGSSTKSLDFGSSIIYTTDYYYTGSGLTLDAGTSTLVFQGTGSDMRGNGSGDIIYNKVIVEGAIDIDAHDHTFQSLELKPGATLNMGAGDTITVTSLIAAGTALSPIIIKSDVSGSQAMLRAALGTQEVSYVELQDIYALGGATFHAYASIDNGNNTGWSFLADETAPSFITSYPQISAIGGSEVVVDVQVDEPSNLYYVVLPASSTAPSVAQIISGTDADDASAINSSLAILEANTTIELLADGLEEVTSYDLYFALQDDAGNVQSTPSVLSVTTIDDSAPLFTDTYPKITLIESTRLEMSVSIREMGTVYYAVLEDDADQPSSTQVKAGTDASDGLAISFGNLTAEVDTEYIVEVTGLVATTAYDIYVVAEDANGNISSTPILLETTTTVTPLDYYWVGGSGDWSDFNNHWATTSGGDTFHTTAPTEFDHVYFDASSFDDAGQELIIDEEAFCGHMNWAGVTHSPLVTSSSFFNLKIYGSLTLSDDMSWDHRYVIFESINAGNTIRMGPTSNYSSNLIFTFSGTGSWMLQDSLVINTISAFNGALDLNDQYVDVGQFYLYSASTLEMSAAEIHANNFRNYTTNAAAISAATSVINVSNSFFAGGSTYNEVVLTKPIVESTILQDDATINTLILEPGAVVSVESETTLFVNELVVTGTKPEGIELYANTPGVPATINQSSGTVNGDYLTLQDITATGGATFNAINSIDKGNNTGWNISQLTPLDYYWVGESGSWSDFANHWATTSGGTTMHANVPGALDNVYFDENSFSASATVTLDINANCAHMDWTGLGSEVTLNQGNTETLWVHGSLTLHPLVISSLSELYFESDDAGQTITTGNSYLANSIQFTGTGGWMLMDSLEASNLEISSGSLDLNDQVVDLSSRFEVSGSSAKSMDFGNSTIYTRDYYYFGSGLTLDAGTSSLVFQGAGSDMRANASGDIIYNKVIIEGTTDIDVYDHTFQSLELKPGATLNMGAGDTITVTSLIADGTGSSPVIIKSDETGAQAMLRVASGMQEVSYVELQDIYALGGATFHAYASTDNGNNTGWSFLKLDQVITFDALETKTFGDDTFDLMATINSALTPTYVSSDESVATISGTTVTIVGAGMTTITASQEGDDKHHAASSVDQLLTVNKADQVITFDALETKTFGDDTFDLMATINSALTSTYVSSNEEVATITGSTVTIVGAGVTTITASQSGGDNHNAAVSIEQTLTVNKADQAITFDPLANKTFGDAAFDLLATGGASSNVLLFTSSDESVASVSGSTVTIVGAGVTTITASQLGDDNYNAASSVDQLLTVNKADQVITFEPLPDVDINVSSVSLSASSSSNLEVTFSLVSGPATLLGSELTLTGEGVVVVTANQLGNDNYDAAASVTQDFNVTDASKTDQVITFDALPEKTYGDEPFELSATGGASGNPVVFTSSDEAVATISGTTVTVIGAGTTTITASQAGDDSHNAASNVNQLLTVNKAGQLIIFDALVDKTFGDAPFELSATGGASENPVTFTSSDETVATVSGTTVTIVGAGITTITASQAGDDNHQAAINVEQDLTVNKADQIVMFDMLSDKTFGDDSFEISAVGGASGNQVTFISSDESVASVSGSTVTIISAGVTTITASQLGDDNYNAASTVDQLLTVNKADQAITFEPLPDVDINVSSVSLFASSSSNLEVTFSLVSGPATLLGSELTLTGEGVVVVTANQLGNDNYDAAAPVTQDFNVTDASKTDQVITFDALPEKTYGDEPFELSATGGASGNPVVFTSSDEAVATISGTTVTVIGAGTTTITASQAGDDSHNAASNVNQLLTVNKAGQLITFNALADKTFGDAPFELSATGGASENPVTFTSSDETVATVSGMTVTIVGAGITTITASQAGDDNYQAATDVEQQLTVNKAEQVITFDALPDVDISVATVNLSASASSNLEVTFSLVSGPAILSGSMLTLTGEGLVEVMASQIGDDNYNSAADVTQSFHVSEDTKIEQVITFNALVDKTFGDAPFELSATGGASENPVTFTSSDETVATVSGTTVTIVGAGITTITASQAGDDNYQAAINVEHDLTVNKAEQIIMFDMLSDKTFGDDSFEISAVGGASGNPVTFISSDESVASVSGSTVTIVGAGVTTITASQLGDDNYNAASSVDQLLTVNKADQVITFEPLPDVDINVSSVSLSASSSSNLEVTFSLVSGPATLLGSELTLTGEGVVVVTANQLGNDNYDAAAPVTQDFNVADASKTDQVITFDALPEKTYGDEPFELSATGGASGNPVVFTSSDEAVATISGTTVTVIGAGTTTITASQAGDDSHNAASNVNQLLTVNKAGQLIIFDALADKTFGDAPFELSATGGASENPVTFTSSDETVATVSGTTVTIVGAGITTITASQAGDDNHQAASDVAQQLTVNKAEQVITFNALPDVDISVATVNLSASASSNLEVTFSLVSGPATLSGSMLTLTGEGLVEVMASQIGDDNYNSAADVTRSFHVSDDTKIEQVITFDALADKTFGDAPFELSATGGASENPVTFTSSDETVATVSGTTVTIVGAGITIITASQAGDDNHQAATDVEQQLTVNKAEQVITLTDIEDQATDAAPFDIVATVDSGLPLTYTVTGVATVSGATITLDGAEGAVTVEVSQEGNNNFNASSLTTTFEVILVLSAHNLDHQINIYPNPTASHIHVDGSEVVSLHFYTLNGQLVKTVNEVVGAIDVQDLPTGVYTLRIVTNGEVAYQNIIKSN